jgi:hypothetical protein
MISPEQRAKDQKLIDDLGGPTKLATDLGFGKGGVQRVHNWRSRGIPSAIRIQHKQLQPRDWLAA